jgi:hypothetical protein
MKMRKLISLVLALVMVFGLAAPVMAAEESVQETAGGRLLSLGVIEGYTDGSLGLDKTITRAEITVILAKICGMGDAANLLKDTPSKFSDVKVNEWYTGWINLASSQGWIKGDPQGTFRPNDPVQHREIVTMLLKALGYDDNLLGDWPTNYLAKAAALGITKDIVSDSKAPAVRGDVFIMTSRTLDEKVVTWNKDDSRFDEKDETLLEAKMSFDKVEGVVTDIPRVTSSLKDNQIRIDGKTYKVVGNVDFEIIFGAEVEAWLNDDGDVVFIDIESDEVLYDAIEVDDDELTLVDADEDYDIDSKANVFINGKSEKVSALDGKKFDYAKVVLNEDGDVAFVDAYNWDDYVVVEEVKGDEIFGYGEELDAEDFTIVKDGKTISIEDVKEGDIVFYNSKAEFAEVFNSTVEGKIEEIFQYEFEVDGKSFDYVNENLDINVKYINEDGDIDNFDEDAAEQMQEEEGTVVVFMDRAGNAVFVSGDLGAVAKSTFGAVLYEAADGYTDTRGREYLELKVVNEEGKAVTYDVRLDDLDEVEVDGTEYEVESVDAGTSNGPNSFADFVVKYKDKGIEKTTTVYLSSAEKGDVVEITLDDSGDVVGLGFFTGSSVEPIDPAAESGDTYIEGKRMSSSVPVFIVDADDVDWDDEDVEVTIYGELEEDVDLNAGNVIHDGSKTLYLVITDSDMQKTTTKTAVLTQVRKDTDGKISRIKALVDGSEVTYYAEDPISAGSWKAGDAAKLVIFDANGKLKDITPATALDTFEKDNNFKVVTKDREIFKNDSTSWKLVDNGYIYDISDTTDIEQMNFSELRDVKNGTTITVIQDGTSSKYIKYVLVGAEPKDDDDKDVTGVVTYISAAATPAGDGSNLVIEVTDKDGNFREYARKDGEISIAVANFLEANRTALNGAGMTFNFDKNGNINGVKAIKLGTASGNLTIDAITGLNGVVIEGTKLTGDLTVKANNVTVKNLEVTGTVTVEAGVTEFTAEGTNFDTLTLEGYYMTVVLDIFFINVRCYLLYGLLHCYFVYWAAEDVCPHVVSHKLYTQSFQKYLRFFRKVLGKGRMFVSLRTNSYAVTVRQAHDGCGN